MTADAKKRIAMVVSGRVQGVGFRFFTRDTARSFGLSGWVRNDSNGTVEIEVQGEDGALERFVGRIRQGPPLGRVADIKTFELPVARAERDFVIR